MAPGVGLEVDGVLDGVAAPGIAADGAAANSEDEAEGMAEEGVDAEAAQPVVGDDVERVAGEVDTGVADAEAWADAEGVEVEGGDSEAVGGPTVSVVSSPPIGFGVDVMVKGSGVT